jgi:ADP-ribosylation factor GTPase-activating protein 2/3
MAAAFDAYTDKNAVFRRLKAKPENKVRAYPLPWI